MSLFNKPYHERCGTRHTDKEPCPMDGGGKSQRTRPICAQTKASATGESHIHVCGKPKGHGKDDDVKDEGTLHACRQNTPAGPCSVIWR